MTETVLWAGCIMLAGAVGALAASAARLPAACGAMVGGFAASMGASGLGLMSQRPDLYYLQIPLVAFICLLAGAEIDLTRLVKERRSIAASVAAQCILVGGLVTLAGLALGQGLGASLVVGICLIPASPTAVMAVASEFRVSGDLTRRLLAQSGIGLLVALLLLAVFLLAAAVKDDSASLPLDLLIGAVMGFAILVPLSRMSLRGAMVAGALLGALVLALAARGPVPRFQHVAAMAMIAGFILGNFTPNRDAIREALRDIGLPCALVLFSASLFGLQAGDLAAGAGAGVAFLSARAAGLMLAGLLTTGGRAGVIQGLAQLPVAGVTSGGPLTALPMITIVVLRAVEFPWQGVLAAVVASEFLGMIAARWALARAGEAPPAEQVTVR